MRITKPPHRLYQHTVGDTVSLKGDGMMRKLEVKNIRPDGYYELWNNSRLSVTASKCHLCVDIK